MSFLAVTLFIFSVIGLVGFFYYKKLQNRALFVDQDQRAGSMAVTLAFACAASKSRIDDCEFEIIKKWFYENMPQTVKDRKFHKALTSTRAFFHAGNKVDNEGICRELIETTTLSQRYSILELCMYVVAADGLATAKELVFLRNLSQWLEADSVKVSMMMESLVPVNIHQVKDAEFILGINNLMSPEDTRDKLNREYRKWNGRVTNSDANIRNQAKLMIELITALKKKRICSQSI